MPGGDTTQGPSMPGACHVADVADRRRPRTSATCVVVLGPRGAHARVVEVPDHHHSAPTAWGPRISSPHCGWSRWAPWRGKEDERAVVVRQKVHQSHTLREAVSG